MSNFQGNFQVKRRAQVVRSGQVVRNLELSHKHWAERTYSVVLRLVRQGRIKAELVHLNRQWQSFHIFLSCWKHGSRNQ